MSEGEGELRVILLDCSSSSSSLVSFSSFYHSGHDVAMKENNRSNQKRERGCSSGENMHAGQRKNQTSTYDERKFLSSSQLDGVSEETTPLQN